MRKQLVKEPTAPQKEGTWKARWWKLALQMRFTSSSGLWVRACSTSLVGPTWSLPDTKSTASALDRDQFLRFRAKEHSMRQQVRPTDARRTHSASIALSFS